MLLRTFFLQIVLGFFVFGANADVVGLRFAGDGEFTRIIVDVADANEHSEALSIENGYTIIMRLPHSKFSIDVTEGPAGGGVETFRWENGLLYLNLHEPMEIARSLDLPPAGRESNHRIVLDLKGTNAEEFASLAGKDEKRLSKWTTFETKTAAPKVLNSPVKVADPETRLSRTYTIVIDPGHGGKDPGASHFGVVESDIVLRSARLLKEMLDKNGRYNVRLTREDDTFIELEDRVTLAREWDADLFISVHADAAANSRARGATVYTLSSKGQRRSEKLISEKKWELPVENGTNDEVSDILGDLVVRETKSNSAIFAEVLHEQLGTVGPLLRSTPRSANYYVLLAPDVPAVLLEMGFLTNSYDAKRLSSARQRDRIMTATAKAIDAYFSKQDIAYAAN